MAKRLKILKNFKMDKYKLSILVSVHTMDECIDIPECDSVYIMHKVRNSINMVEIMSRSLRIKDGKQKSGIFVWCEKYKELKKINDIIKKYDSDFITKLMIKGIMKTERNKIIKKVNHPTDDLSLSKDHENEEANNQEVLSENLTISNIENVNDDETISKDNTIPTSEHDDETISKDNTIPTSEHDDETISKDNTIPTSEHDDETISKDNNIPIVEYDYLTNLNKFKTKLEFTCNLCKYKSNKSDSLKKHSLAEKHKRKIVKNTECFKCVACEFKSSCVDEYIKHHKSCRKNSLSSYNTLYSQIEDKLTKLKDENDKLNDKNDKLINVISNYSRANNNVKT